MPTILPNNNIHCTFCDYLGPIYNSYTAINPSNPNSNSFQFNSYTQ